MIIKVLQKSKNIFFWVQNRSPKALIVRWFQLPSEALRETKLLGNREMVLILAFYCFQRLWNQQPYEDSILQNLDWYWWSWWYFHQNDFWKSFDCILCWLVNVFTFLAIPAQFTQTFMAPNSPSIHLKVNFRDSRDVTLLRKKSSIKTVQVFRSVIVYIFDQANNIYLLENELQLQIFQTTFPFWTQKETTTKF